MSTLKTNLKKWCAALAILPVLGGCAATQALHDSVALSRNGDLEPAVQRLQAAQEKAPEDLRLKTAVHRKVDLLVSQYQKEAQAAMQAGDENTALARFQSILTYDGGNLQARQEIERLQARMHLRRVLAQAESMKTSDPKEALKRVQQVLEEQPSWPQALTLRDALMRQIAEQEMLSPSLDRKLRKPVSLSFREHNLIGIFETISQLAKVNFIFDSEVPKSATASISASNTTAEDAINLLLVTNQLRKKVLNHNTLLIYPAKATKEKEYRDIAVKTFFLSHADGKSVGSALRTMLKIRDLHVDERINAVVVRDVPESIALAERLVQALDRPEAEVTLDVQVLEVNSSDLLNLGIKYPQEIGVGIGSKTAEIPLNLVKGLTSNDMFVNLGSQKGLALSMLQKSDSTQVLANPQIRVKNGKKAEIVIGQRIPVITNILTDRGGAVEKVDMQDVGLKFNVQPTISLNGEISVDVDLTVSSLGHYEESPKKAKYYRVNNRSAKTTLTARNNEVQVLAGLISRTEKDVRTGLPGASQVPLLDRLFGARDGSTEKSEIVLVITPRIERGLDLPGAHVTTFLTGSEARPGDDALSLRATETPPPLAPPGDAETAPAGPGAAPVVGAGAVSLPPPLSVPRVRAAQLAPALAASHPATGPGAQPGHHRTALPSTGLQASHAGQTVMAAQSAPANSRSGAMQTPRAPRLAEPVRAAKRYARARNLATTSAGMVAALDASRSAAVQSWRAWRQGATTVHDVARAATRAVAARARTSLAGPALSLQGPSAHRKAKMSNRPASPAGPVYDARRAVPWQHAGGPIPGGMLAVPGLGWPGTDVVRLL
ncbi:secretin N-terminal domain-containing protein [Pandoraea sp.]|uniref:secretin N-terminal domain-containing protein n=1 Tax=Pandoraea sp. TaxID=1883445 RepID=UPI0011F92015|nr:secretin N-terminal domain-containing protein [Pandoraea sp.]TAL53577.1 MAG: bacterial type II and III secretion system family protein [Pandoraea sp.]TAM14880.1 MAG: bacterial type II and III secretion system family protein [Pandoraea sp.]